MKRQKITDQLRSPVMISKPFTFQYMCTFFCKHMLISVHMFSPLMFCYVTHDSSDVKIRCPCKMTCSVICVVQLYILLKSGLYTNWYTGRSHWSHDRITLWTELPGMALIHVRVHKSNRCLFSSLPSSERYKRRAGEGDDPKGSRDNGGRVELVWLASI